MNGYLVSYKYRTTHNIIPSLEFLLFLTPLKYCFLYFMGYPIETRYPSLPQLCNVGTLCEYHGVVFSRQNMHGGRQISQTFFPNPNFTTSLLFYFILVIHANFSCLLFCHYSVNFVINRRQSKAIYLLFPSQVMICSLLGL